MSCNLATEQAAACASGIGKLTDPIQLLQVIAENYAELSLAGNAANTNTVDAIRARACVSGIGKLTDENALWRIIAQNVCALANSDTPVESCDTVTISGAGTAGANQAYTKISSTVYTGNTSPSFELFFNAGTNLWTIESFALGTLYRQTGTFPGTWVTVGGADPAPIGVCS